MVQHYPTTSIAAAVLSSHLSLFLLCFSFTHTPYYLTERFGLSKTLLFVQVLVADARQRALWKF